MNWKLHGHMVVTVDRIHLVLAGQLLGLLLRPNLKRSPAEAHMVVTQQARLVENIPGL